MHMPKGRSFRPATQGRLRLLWAVLLGFALAVLLLVLLRSSNDSSSKVPVGMTQRHIQSLAAERAALVKQIQTWNAKANGFLGRSLEAISLASHNAAIRAGGSLIPETHGLGTSGATSNVPNDTDYCDVPDPSPQYRMRPAVDVAKENPELVGLLRKHAKNNEIMLTLANGIMICKNTTLCWWKGGNILESFITILRHNHITNYLIGVMDDETEKYVTDQNPPVNWFRVNIPIPDVQKKSHPANQVSTIKYTLIKTFLQLRYNVLITDMDLVYFSNPFDHLHRDADIEIQTDGFDTTAYGVLDSVTDKTMGWGGGGLFFRTFTTNVGCVWVKANARTFKLMVQVSEHLAKTPGWDQQIFNEYLMRPSFADHQMAYVHLRVMDINYWLNSKIFFRSRRSQYIPGAQSIMPTPILVHMNYHPDKHPRMLCLMDRYFYGNVSACDHFPGGSEPGT